MHKHSFTSNENPILATWQAQMQNARANPFLLNLLLKQWQRVLQRLAYFYEQLATLPRRNRRALQRALATSLVGAAMLLALSSAPVALANSITVGGACTLDEAIGNANDTTTGQPYADCAAGNPAGTDTIYLTADVTLSAALPSITSNITLEGNSYFVSGANSFRVFSVSGTGNFTLDHTTVKYGSANDGGGILVNTGGIATLNNSTVSGNQALDAGGGIAIRSGGTVELNDSIVSANDATAYGGGIANYGTLTLNNSTVNGKNQARYGGGIYNSRGTATLNNSTVSGNTANDGGGIYGSGGKMTLNNSTVSGNTAYGKGGGAFVATLGYMYLNNSTVSGNNAPRGGGIFLDQSSVILFNATLSGNTASIYGGGVANYGVLYSYRSLISGNSATISGSEIYNAGQTYHGYNLFGYNGETNAQAFHNFAPAASDFNATSDGDGTSHHTTPSGTPLASILNTSLANNGGPTQTHALVSGSPAIDQAPSAACTSAPINDVDQRGDARNVNINNGNVNFLCDIGAYEFQATTAVNVTGVNAHLNAKQNAVVKWRTTSETQIAGFNIYRKTKNAQWKMLNAQFKQAKHAGDVLGDKYRFTDKNVKAGKTYRYKIEVVYLDGHSEWTDAVRVKLSK